MVDGGLISVFLFFHRFLLEMGVLVHPHSGLLWPASLPCVFVFLFVLYVTFEETHDFLLFFNDVSSKLL